MNRPKYSQHGIEELIKRENELYRQLHQRTFIDFFIDNIPDVTLFFFFFLYLIGRALFDILSVILPALILPTLCGYFIVLCFAVIYLLLIERTWKKE